MVKYAEKMLVFFENLVPTCGHQPVRVRATMNDFEFIGNSIMQRFPTFFCSHTPKQGNKNWRTP